LDLNPIYDCGIIFSYLKKNYKLDEYQDFIGLFDIHNDLTFKYGTELLLELNKVFNITKEDSKIIVNQWVEITDATVNLNKYWVHNQPIITLLDTITHHKSVGVPSRRFYEDKYFKNMIENYNNDTTRL
jgi:hypothetical protein